MSKVIKISTSSRRSQTTLLNLNTLKRQNMFYILYTTNKSLIKTYL